MVHNPHLYIEALLAGIGLPRRVRWVKGYYYTDCLLPPKIARLPAETAIELACGADKARLIRNAQARTTRIELLNGPSLL